MSMKPVAYLAITLPHYAMTDAGPMDSYPQIFDRFAECLLPSGLSDATLLEFMALGHSASPAKGDEIRFPEDASGDCHVFLSRGASKLVAHASGGREQIVAFHFAGDFVYVPASTSHAYVICALEECDLLVFPGEAFQKLACREPEILTHVLERVELALSRCRDKAVSLGRKCASERLADFLLGMGERIGIAEGGGCTMSLPMSRRDIGDSLGLTIETISRQLTELKDAGLLETSGRSTVRLLDIEAIKERAGHFCIAV